MRKLETIAKMKSVCRGATREGKTLGFVPTMGALHEGHLSLVRTSRVQCDVTAVSIFVNPLQFGPSEDLEKYPRTLQRDAATLEEMGVDFLFAPSVAEMYPPGAQTHVEVGELSGKLDGASRPGHFRGVATVVCKLFEIVRPHRAYFGQKDAAQVAVLRKMVRDLSIDVEMVVCPIVREADGLAMSSRNVYLSPDERRVAPVLSRSLHLAEELYEAGERDAGLMRARISALIAPEPLASIDYVSVADAESLEELTTVDRPALVSLAVRFGRTRLIDNTTLGT